MDDKKICRFREQETPNERCGCPGTYIVSVKDRHVMVVCDEHMTHYLDKDGNGRMRFDNQQYIIRRLHEPG